MTTKSVSYDPVVIQEFAQRLYRQAAWAIFRSTFLGIFFGALAGAVGAGMAGLRGDIGSMTLLGLAVGIIAGLIHGRERAFKLRLEAQTALCQLQIERNTSGKSA